MALKIGFVGCGGMGSVHLNCLKALSSCLPIDVTAIADLQNERLQAALALFPHSKGYSLGEDLIEKENVDVVYVCLPSYLHASHAALALKKGRDVFVEKPVCLSLDEAQGLLQAQKESGREVMVGQVVRFFPEFLFLKTLLAEKTYGQLKSIDLLRSSGAPIWGYENWFMDEKRSGSVVLDLHIHDLDFLRYLLGEPTIQSVAASTFPDGMINRIVTSYRFGSVSAVAEGMWHVSPKVPFISAYRAEFQGAAVLCRMFANPSVVVYPLEGEPIVPSFPKEGEVKGSGVNIADLGAYYVEDRYFLNCLLTHRKNDIAPLNEGVKSLETVLKERAMAHRQ
jgi:predicted dehydrogenase